MASENNIFVLVSDSGVALASYSGLEKQETHHLVKDDPVSEQPPPASEIREKAGRSVLKYLVLLHWCLSFLIVL